KTITAKSEDILRSIATGLSNGVLEAINGNVQAAKCKAKGYRTKRNLKATSSPVTCSLIHPFEIATSLDNHRRVCRARVSCERHNNGQQTRKFESAHAWFPSTPALGLAQEEGANIDQYLRLAEDRSRRCLSALVTPVLTIAAAWRAHEFGEAALLSVVEGVVQRLCGRNQLLEICGSLGHPLRPHLQPFDKVAMLVLTFALFSPGGKALGALLGLFANSGLQRRPILFLVRRELEPRLQSRDPRIQEGGPVLGGHAMSLGLVGLRRERRAGQRGYRKRRRRRGDEERLRQFHGW